MCHFIHIILVYVDLVPHLCEATVSTSLHGIKTGPLYISRAGTAPVGTRT